MVPKERPEAIPERKDERTEAKQNSLIHEGAKPDPRYDTNERADSRVRVRQPDGEDVPGKGLEKE